MGWFPEEFVTEVRAARAQDRAAAPRRKASGSRRRRPAAPGRAQQATELMAVRGTVAAQARMGRLLGAGALVARVLVAVWLTDTHGVAALALGVVVVAVWWALRQIAANAAAQHATTWVVVAAAVWLAGVAGVVAWLVTQPALGVAGLVVVSEVLAAGATAVLAAARQDARNSRLVVA